MARPLRFLDPLAGRPALNYRAILAEFETAFSSSISVRYGRTCQATPGLVRVGLGQLQTLLGDAQDAAARRSIATFVLGHEFFHVYLKHPDVVYGRPPRGFVLKRSRGCRYLFELQADYLAARYLVGAGLSLEPVLDMFEDTVRFRERADYPGGAERFDNVRRAGSCSFQTRLFANGLVDCLEFLEHLTHQQAPR